MYDPTNLNDGSVVFWDNTLQDWVIVSTARPLPVVIPITLSSITRILIGGSTATLASLLTAGTPTTTIHASLKRLIIVPETNGATICVGGAATANHPRVLAVDDRWVTSAVAQTIQLFAAPSVYARVTQEI